MIKKIIISLFIVFSSISFASSIQIPTKLIESGISLIMPIEKEYALKGKMTIKNPSVEIKDNLIYLTVEYDNLIFGKSASGQMTFSSDLYYDVDSTNVYLKSLNFVSFTANNTSFNPNGNFITRSIIKNICNKIEKKPIYTASENILTKFLSIKDVNISNDKITVIF